MWYCADETTLTAAGGPLARGLLAACQARWGTAAVGVDLEVVHLQPGSLAAPPVARRLYSTAWWGCGPEDEVALLVESNHPILKGIAGGPVFLPASARVEGVPWPSDAEPGLAVLALARRIAPGEALNRRRWCARVFADQQPYLPIPDDAPMPAWAEARPLRFQSGYRVLGHLGPYTPTELADEPMPEAATPAWVMAHGGPIAKAFVRALPEAWWDPAGDTIIQGKLNELAPGFWPCLAGWHMDGTSRINRRADGTADLLNPGQLTEQIICCLGDVSQTGFLLGRINIPVVPEGLPPGTGKPVIQRILAESMARGELMETAALSGAVLQFGFGDFHDCRPAQSPGWRYFIKAMRLRRDIPRNRFAERTQVTWPLGTGAWPEDPLGAFPAHLPSGLGARLLP